MAATGLGYQRPRGIPRTHGNGQAGALIARPAPGVDAQPQGATGQRAAPREEGAAPSPRASQTVGAAPTAAAPAEEGPKRAATRAGRRRGAILAAAVAILVVAAAAGAAFFYAGKVSGPSSASGTGAQPLETGPTYSFDPFIVNIAGTNGTRYLKATISLECRDRKVSQEMGKADYRVRDAVLEVLSRQTLEDLTDPAKREDIRRQVGDAVESVLSNGGGGQARIRGVYFLEFVIQ